MKQRNGKNSRISLTTCGRRKQTKIYDRVQGSIEYQQKRIAYDREKQGDTDTIERKAIHHFEIKRLIEYGLSEKETVERLKEKFSSSKYTTFFENWVKDGYKKIKPISHSKEEEPQR